MTYTSEVACSIDIEEVDVGGGQNRVLLADMCRVRKVRSLALENYCTDVPCTGYGSSYEGHLTAQPTASCAMYIGS